MKRKILVLSILWVLPLSAEPTCWDFIYRQWAEACLTRAAEKGNLENTKYYLNQRGVNVNSPNLLSSLLYGKNKNYTPLVAAITYDHWRVVKYLLKNGATLSSGSELKMAVRHRKTIHTPFILMLWGGKEDIEGSQKREALEEIKEELSEFGGIFNNSFTKQMVSNFEAFVRWKNSSLLPELQDEIIEYKRTVPLETICEGENYKFD